jgi:hypothetical protein
MAEQAGHFPHRLAFHEGGRLFHAKVLPRKIRRMIGAARVFSG